MGKGDALAKVSERLSVIQDVAVQLMEAKDTDQLLHLIVEKATALFECDAGSLYIKKDDKDLGFMVAINHSIETNFQRTTVPIKADTLASYVFRTNKPLRINDVYELPSDSPYRYKTEFDRKIGYRCKSMLVHPLTTSQGEVLGIIQLINRKQEFDAPWPSQDPSAIESMPGFTEDDVKLLQSFASLTSARLEQAKLYQNIEDLFKGFVRAAVRVIEQRDPSTRGHSERVAVLSTDLAAKINRCNDSRFRYIAFTESQIEELSYASLLHDFGKVNVKEATLLKKKKLYEFEHALLRSRFDRFRDNAEIKALRELINELIEAKRAPGELDLARLRKTISASEAELEHYWGIVQELNEPTILNADNMTKLQKLENGRSSLRGRQPQPLLNEAEMMSLSIPRGSLTETERREIEGHVTSTYQFLKEIPWTKRFEKVPEIASAHHEKLDGTGYPRQLEAKDIPIQSRIMTICDIFDALAAADRPYKKALPLEKALEILKTEAHMGKLDPSLLELFIEAKVYENAEFLKLNVMAKKKAA